MRILTRAVVNLSESIAVMWDDHTRRASLDVLVRRGEDSCRVQYVLDVPLPALRTFGVALAVDNAESHVDLGSRHAVIVPRPMRAALVAISSATELERVFILDRRARRRIIRGLAHARAAAQDASLLDEGTTT